jgi:AraC-like DNA-binding protein/quercetin dioxygenase-like cupin family protein
MDNLTIKEGFLGQRMIVLPEMVKNRFKKNDLTANFYVTDLGYYPKANHHSRIRDKGTNEFIFLYCIEGEGWLEIEERRLKITPNQFFIIPKNIIHSYGAESGNPWSIYWMHFDGISAPDLYDRYKLKVEGPVTIPFSNHRIVLFNQIFDLFNSGYLELQMEYACISSLNFISSFIFHDINKSLNMNGHENLVDSIKDFLLNNLDKTFKVNDISKEFNYSPSYVFNIFKKGTGYSIIHFFNLKKIQKACEYMNYTDKSIKEISFKLGFQDPYYFSRIFKNYMGVSPRTYKNNY